MSNETRENGKGGRHLKAAPETPSANERPVKKKRHVGRTVIIVIAALIVAVLLAAFLIFHDLYSQMNQPTVTPAPTQQTATSITPEPTPSPSPTPEPLTEEEKQQLAEMELRSSLQESAEEVMQSDDVYNMLLIGSDSLTGDLERSDAMLLLSVNMKTKTIWITSLMRDTQVEIADWGVGHLNWATRFGGIDMLVKTVESERNFAVHIDNWAMVNFAEFIRVADLLAPVTVTLTERELRITNGLIREAARAYDQTYGYTEDNYRARTYLEGGAGEYTLTDGVQILGYCRERKLGGDTGRSQKQRDVLMQMWENAKKMSLTEQYNLAKQIMSIIHTDLTMGQCASLLLKAPEFLTYDIQAQQCPTPGSFWRGRDADGLSIYNADWVVNRNFLRATIYGEEMSAADLTSGWTGERVQVYFPPETDTAEDSAE